MNGGGGNHVGVFFVGIRVIKIVPFSFLTEIHVFKTFLIASFLLFFRLCDPQPTDIIIDPMCGTGAIPIEVIPPLFYNL